MRYAQGVTDCDPFLLIAFLYGTKIPCTTDNNKQGPMSWDNYKITKQLSFS